MTPEERLANLAKGRQKSIEVRQQNKLDKGKAKTELRPETDDLWANLHKQSLTKLQEIAANGFKIKCVSCLKEEGHGDTIRDLITVATMAFDRLYKNEPTNIKQEFRFDMRVTNRDTGEVHVPRIIEAEAVVKDESPVDKS